MTERERFDRCLRVVLRFEAGDCDEPPEPDGPEPPAGAAALLRDRYWLACGCDRLAAGLDLLVFDTAVNMGPGAAARILQAALGHAADGEIAARTLAAADAAARGPLIGRIARLRTQRYRALAGFPMLGARWLRRLQTAQTLALAWAGEDAREPIGDAA
jgi:lysozyme family protein